MHDEALHLTGQAPSVIILVPSAMPQVVWDDSAGAGSFGQHSDSV